jgi:hypothetical protein
MYHVARYSRWLPPLLDIEETSVISEIVNDGGDF